MALRSALVSSLLILSAKFCSVANAQASNVSVPINYPFYSRPDLDAVVLNVTFHNDSFVSPGYIFLSPYQVANPGPYIFDNSGNLVWSGFSQAGPSVTHDFRVCQWNGADHLCLYQGNQALGYSRGHGVMMDSSFHIVNSVQTGGGLPPADQHEFHTLNGGKTALMTIFHQRQYDLSAFNVTNGVGWIMEGVFQEVDTMTSEVLFEWRSLDFVDPSASFVPPNTTDVSGDGLTKDTAWDYFHINAVDKTPNGDYLVSGRHTEALYRISGTNGSIIWELGGKHSSFKQNFNFSYQHDVRWRAENSTSLTISIFDNGWDGFNGTADFSEGKVIAINNATMSATLVQAYGNPHPYGRADPSGGLLSASQGNMQILPNGNVFLGWGSNAFVSESKADGTPVFSAYFAQTGGLHYRAYKFNFTSNPSDVPALYTYAHNDTAPTTFYASWNGATEVASWNYYGGSSAKSMKKLGNTKKIGFETITTQPGFFAFTMTEAVAGNGSALRNSSVIKTFVPGSGLAAVCTEIQCPLIGNFSSPTAPQEVTPVAGTSGSEKISRSWSLYGLVAIAIAWFVR